MIKFAYWSWSILSLAAFATVLHTSSREKVRDYFMPEQRVLISTVMGDVLGDGTPVQVAKIRTRDSLILEVYIPAKDGSRLMIDRIVLDEKRDGYFTLNGNLTNLAIDDVDGDNQLEILAPAFDQNLTAHLNVFKFDRSSKTFLKVTQAY